MSTNYFKNKDGRVFPKTRHLIRNQAKLGLIECGVDEARAYEASNQRESDDVNALKARIAELEDQQAGSGHSAKLAKLPDGVDEVDAERLVDNEDKPSPDLTPAQKAVETRRKNQAAKANK
ncbi:hypothetical protein [Gayadomonas joobiniege]|uniref:hypothetical protein n=1 Tax=Gayadomonas joobiniege TaxID=1234606 RepID=UPI000368369D|nr:hypothetical protein [Gayadomonas joobiniege]